jgi:hypothetical protein
MGELNPVVEQGIPTDPPSAGWGGRNPSARGRGDRSVPSLSAPSNAKCRNEIETSKPGSELCRYACTRRIVTPPTDVASLLHSRNPLQHSESRTPKSVAPQQETRTHTMPVWPVATHQAKLTARRLVITFVPTTGKTPMPPSSVANRCRSPRSVARQRQRRLRLAVSGMKDAVMVYLPRWGVS